MRKILKAYAQLEEHVLLMIKAEFFIQLIGAAFFLILNIYLAKEGFTDPEIANFISYRFLAVMVLAFPLGLYIKGRQLKPFFIAGSVGVPMMAILMVYSISRQWYEFLPFSFVMWGVFFSCFQVSTLPYIMRNTKKENQSHAISLSYSTHSFGTIISGMAIFSMVQILGVKDEGIVLTVISLVGFLGIYFLKNLKIDKIDFVNNMSKTKKHDWSILIKALLPTFIISVGAGLTIPFINLFFYHSFDISSSGFALIGGGASLLVAIMSLLVPNVKKRLGFKRGITFTQSIAVLALVALATTEFFAHYWWALPIAILCFWIRTPLMNMAAPMTSELTMNYVGKDNRELLSAITAAIWSGNWFISSQIFRWLKSMELDYAYIFYITAILYSFGVFTYYLLVKDYNKRKDI